MHHKPECNDGLACTTDINGNRTSQLATDKCLIANTCYDANAFDVSNPCQQCQPSIAFGA